MKYAKAASFTVEAAILFPIMVFVIAAIVNLAVEQHQMVEKATINLEEITEFDPVSIIKTKEWMTQVWERWEKESVP